MTSRAELLGLPEVQKQNVINAWVNNIIRAVKVHAIDRNTSIQFQSIPFGMPVNAMPKGSAPRQLSLPEKCTMEDVLPYIKKAFVDCYVTYEGVWTEVRSGQKQSPQFHTILTIDWS